MYNTYHIRLVLAVCWIVALSLVWWGYGQMMARYDLQREMDQVQVAAAREEWPQASAAERSLHQRWQRARPLVELNFGGGLIEDFDAGLARLRGGISARDPRLVHVSIAELTIAWQGLQSPYPDGK